MPPRKRKNYVGSVTKESKRAKRRLAKETMQQREIRLERGRIRGRMVVKRRAKREIELLDRLETMLQAEVRDEDNHDKISTEDDDDLVCTSILQSESLQNEFSLFSKFIKEEPKFDETDETFESEMHFLQSTETDQNVDLKSDTNHLSEINEQLIHVKEEIIDESYGKFEFVDHKIKEEDSALCETIHCDNDSSAGMNIDSQKHYATSDPIGNDLECDDFKNVVLLEESNCDIKFRDEDCALDEEDVKSNNVLTKDVESRHVPDCVLAEEDVKSSYIPDCTLAKEDVESSHVPQHESAPVNQTETKVESIFECDVCRHQYLSKTRLKVHSLIHELYPELNFHFKCHVCEKRFTRKFGVKKHMLTHHNVPTPCPKTIKCDVCEKIFSRKKNLNYHLLTHHFGPDVEYLYKCQVCGEKFFRKRSFKMHAFTHNPEFDSFDSKVGHSVYWFQCDVCKKKFMNKTGLNKHTIKYHSNPLAYMFECEMESAVDDEPLYPVGRSSPQRSEEIGEKIETNDNPQRSEEIGEKFETNGSPQRSEEMGEKIETNGDLQRSEELGEKFETNDISVCCN